MSDKDYYVGRLRPSQTDEISETRNLRDRATALTREMSKEVLEEKDYNELWDLLKSAGIVLRASNTELTSRAKLSNGFFSSVPRNNRRPQRSNCLKALSVIINVSEERLHDVDNRIGPVEITREGSPFDFSILGKSSEVIALSICLEKIARQEIERIFGERPNSPEKLLLNQKQIDILNVMADGLSRISLALAELDIGTDRAKRISSVKLVIRSVGEQVSKWWGTNGAEFLNIPAFGAGVALLHLVGADMTIATSAVAVMAGGPPVAKVLASVGGISKKSKD